MLCNLSDVNSGKGYLYNASNFVAVIADVRDPLLIFLYIGYAAGCYLRIKHGYLDMIIS